jgi:uncharacterized repeat protein (TIGR01451 family)
MRSPKGLIVACAVALVAASSVVAAGALISGSSGSVIHLTSPPASVALNKLQNATKVHVFDEQQGATLAAATAVDAVDPGTYAAFPAGSATIPAGTVVNSHLIHSDITAFRYTARRQGSVTFSSDILGVVASTAKLAASDTLGAPGTTYAGSINWRGLETSENGWSNVGDKFTISTNRRTVTFDIKTYYMDEIRVITAAANPLVTSISDSPDPVQAGGEVTYTITVTNNGSSAADAVQVQDQFPGATFVSASASGGCTPGSGTVTCDLGSIAAGGSAVATVVVTAPSSGTLTNTATSPPGQTPAASTTTSVVSPSLTTEISDSPDPVTAGLDVQYTLTVTNNGLFPVADAHVVDTLPPGTSLVSASAGCTGTGPVDCALGALAVGASAEVQLVVTSPGTVPSGGTMTNSAVATPGTNPTGTETTTVEPEQDGVAKGFVSPGGSITIEGDDPATLSLPNTGDGAPVLITQSEGGTFCGGEECTGTTTTISDFDGYLDPLNPIHLVLEYNFPSSATSLADAADAYAATIYKNVDPENPNVGTAVPFCTTPLIAIPSPCVSSRAIEQPSMNTFVVTFEVVYLSGDPKFGRR